MCFLKTCIFYTIMVSLHWSIRHLLKTRLYPLRNINTLYVGKINNKQKASPQNIFQKLSKLIQQNPNLQVETYDYIETLLSKPNQLLIMVSCDIKGKNKIHWRGAICMARVVLYTDSCVGFHVSDHIVFDRNSEICPSSFG